MKCTLCGAPVQLDMDAEPMFVDHCAINHDVLFALVSLLAACEGAKLPRNLAIHLTEAKALARDAIKKASP